MNVFGSGLSGPAFQRRHQRARFTTDKSTGASVHDHIKIEARAQDVLPQKPIFLGLLDGNGQILYGQRVFLSNVDIALPAADGKSADHQSLEDRVGVALQQAAVHICARVALIGIDDHIFDIAGGVARFGPLASGGKTAAAPSSQIGFCDFLQYLFGAHLEKRFFQGGITADGQIVIDAFGIDTAVGAENKPLLMLVKGNIGFVRYLLPGVGIGIEQALYHPITIGRMGYNLRRVFRRYLEISAFFGVIHNNGTPLTKPVAAGLPEGHLVAQTLFFNLGFNAGRNLATAGGLAGRPGTQRNTGFFRIPAG